MTVLKDIFVSTSAVRPGAVAITLTEFDQRRYLRLIDARGETIRAVVAELKDALGLSTALDAGCGVGFFAQILQECGLSVGASTAGWKISWRRANDFRRFRSNKAMSRVQDSCAWRVRSHFMFWIVVPPGKSDARNSALASAHGQRIAAGEHVHPGDRRRNGVARGACGRGPELDGYCAVSERGVPGEDAVPRGLCRGVPRGGAAGPR